MKTRAIVAMLALSGCNRDGLDSGNPMKDMAFSFPEEDLGGEGDLAQALNPCGDQDPSCVDRQVGPPLPLQSDAQRDPWESDDGLERDQTGAVVLAKTKLTFDYVWIANTGDWGKGTVSKIDGKGLREVARYFSVTCGSLPSGSSQACDGKSGCCARDGSPQFEARRNKWADPGYQQVNVGANDPSRTAVDHNGDLFVSNRAFSGQSSVTKIANDVADCIDRNKNGRIDTSRDVSGDKMIQTDCNEDGVPDDLAGVKAIPCLNGLQQEFYGLDDECVLFTTNTNKPLQYGRPLAIGVGLKAITDAWAGTYQDGKFHRIDGTTGLTLDVAQLSNQCHPYGAAIDSQGYLWSVNLGSGVCYFDTNNVSQTGKVRQPNGFGQSGYGISLDRDQNVWVVSSSAYRYTPDRTQGFLRLGQGLWTVFNSPGLMNGGGTAHTVAADSRGPKSYFVWVTGGTALVQIPASAVAVPMGNDLQVDATAYPAVKIAGFGKGVGVTGDQNVVVVSHTNQMTRVKVDANGAMTAPDLMSPADVMAWKDSPKSNPSPYTYSDFTGFGLRNFTRPSGTYSYIVAGCGDGAEETTWKEVAWDADVPPGTSLGVSVRSGVSAMPDVTWEGWSGPYEMSPLLLGAKSHNYLQVRFDFASKDKMATPRLRSFNVRFVCGG